MVVHWDAAECRDHMETPLFDYAPASYAGEE